MPLSTPRVWFNGPGIDLGTGGFRNFPSDSKVWPKLRTRPQNTWPPHPIPFPHSPRRRSWFGANNFFPLVSPYLNDVVWSKLMREFGVLSDPLEMSPQRSPAHFWLSLSPFVQYGVVLDAGSSRTTVYVYQWPAEKENNTGVVSQTFKCSVKGKAQSVCRSPIEKQGRVPRAFKEAWRDPKKLPKGRERARDWASGT